MWLKILSPSPSRRGVSGNVARDHCCHDAEPDAIVKDCLPKKTPKPSSSSKIKTLVKNGKSRGLKLKQDSSKRLHSRSAEEPPKLQDNETNLQRIKIATAKRNSNFESTSNRAGDTNETLARRYWVRSTTQPNKSSQRESELLWNDLGPAWPDPEPTAHALGPTQHNPDSTSHQPTRFPCDISCLTDDLNSDRPEQAVRKGGLDDVKLATKEAFFKALLAGRVVAEAGKTAAEAIYQKSVTVGGMPSVVRSPNDLVGTALEINSATTQTTSRSSDSSSRSQNQSAHDEHKAVIEKRLTDKASKARGIRCNRLSSSRNQRSNSNQSKKLQFRQRDVLPKKEEIVMDEASTIVIEEGNDCFLMTKEDFDDLVDTFQSLTGKGNGPCDCFIAKDIIDWFMGVKSQGNSREHVDFVEQAATAITKNMDRSRLWKTIMGQDPSYTAVTTTSFVDEDMRGSEDTIDSGCTGRTPKTKNTRSKFADDDMAPTTPSPISKRKAKVVPDHASTFRPIVEDANVTIEKGRAEEGGPNEALDDKFEPAAVIRTDDLLVAYGGKAGQLEDVIETMLVSDEISRDNDYESSLMLEHGDVEHGDDILSEDDSISSIPLDEATDATQCSFMFDIHDEKKYDWDYGQYKVNSRDCEKMPTIHEVDIDTIVYENCDDDYSHDLSSITPDVKEHSIGIVTTETGGAISPVKPPAMMHRVDPNRQADLKRRLKDLEAGLNQLQGDYNQIQYSCQTVESILQPPPAVVSNWGPRYDGVEEQKECFEYEYDEMSI